MKRVMKKLGCLLLIACMMIGCISPVYAASYNERASWMFLTDGEISTKKTVTWYTRKGWSYQADNFPWKIKSVKSSNNSCVQITKVNTKNGLFIFKSKKKGKVKITMSTNKGKKYFYIAVDSYLKPEKRQLTVNKYTNINYDNHVISYKYKKSNGKHVYVKVWDGYNTCKITKSDIMYGYADVFSYLKVTVDGKVAYNKQGCYMPGDYYYDSVRIPIRNTKGKHKIVISRYGTTKVVYINIK